MENMYTHSTGLRLTSCVSSRGGGGQPRDLEGTVYVISCDPPMFSNFEFFFSAKVSWTVLASI